MENYNYENTIDEFIENNQIIFFFKHKDKFYGASEDSRLVFAGLKDGTFSKESRFIGIELHKNMDEKKEKTFSKNDIKDIKIIDEKDAIKGLTK